MNMPIGMIILLMVAALVYFGVTQRLLDRMRLTDRQALLFIAAIIVGSFFDVTIAFIRDYSRLDCLSGRKVQTKRFYRRSFGNCDK